MRDDYQTVLKEVAAVTEENKALQEQVSVRPGRLGSVHIGPHGCKCTTCSGDSNLCAPVACPPDFLPVPRCLAVGRQLLQLESRKHLNTTAEAALKTELNELQIMGMAAAAVPEPGDKQAFWAQHHAPQQPQAHLQVSPAPPSLRGRSHLLWQPVLCLRLNMFRQFSSTCRPYTDFGALLHTAASQSPTTLAFTGGVGHARLIVARLEI